MHGRIGSNGSIGDYLPVSCIWLLPCFYFSLISQPYTCGASMDFDLCVLDNLKLLLRKAALLTPQYNILDVVAKEELHRWVLLILVYFILISITYLHEFHYLCSQVLKPINYEK